VTHVAKIFRFVRYKMSDVETGAIDYDAMREVARREKPKIILAGYSSYPRTLNYEIINSIAKEVGAYAVADIAHFAGLIAGKAMDNPLHHGFDLLISTTHKTLRGPRGGVIISKEPTLGAKVDKSVFPGLQGGPIVQMIAAKAVAFKEASASSFADYATQVLKNAKALADGLMSRGMKLITNGTDNHLVLMDAIRSLGTSGQTAETRLDAAGITVNKNVIPDDARPATDPSGVRIGTPALTTRGMREREMDMVADWIVRAANTSDIQSHSKIRAEVRELAREFRVPGILIG
jgi:glycine hydroxymethyltransferase